MANRYHHLIFLRHRFVRASVRPVGFGGTLQETAKYGQDALGRILHAQLRMPDAKSDQ